VYQRFKERGYEVFAVNPNADTIEDGDPCYRSLEAIPGGVDGVVVATAPGAGTAVIEDCLRLGIGRAWMHRSFGSGSVSHEAADTGRKGGMVVIEGGCPLMFDPTADFGHKCMRWMIGLTSSKPKAD
jgi:uncharacterized protein